MIVSATSCRKSKRAITVSLIDELPRASIQADRRESVSEKVFVVRGERRRVLAMRPGSRVKFDMLVPARARLSFGIATPEHTWRKGGDGVLFKIEVDQGTDENETIYSTYINPKAVEVDRRWHDMSLDLSTYEGQRVKLIFITNPGPDNNPTFDLAGFSEPKLTGLQW